MPSFGKFGTRNFVMLVTDVLERPEETEKRQLFYHLDQSGPSSKSLSLSLAFVITVK